MVDVFLMNLSCIQPSQLWISAEKLSRVQEHFVLIDVDALPPIPVKQLGCEVIFTDGHTRALAAHLAGLSEVSVYWDEDDLDWEAYEICVGWCKEVGIHTITDLEGRVLSTEEYEVLWHRRCDVMHQALEIKRSRGEISCLFS